MYLTWTRSIWQKKLGPPKTSLTFGLTFGHCHIYSYRAAWEAGGSIRGPLILRGYLVSCRKYECEGPFIFAAQYEVQCGTIRGTGGMIRGPVWHNTRSLPIGFTVAAQYEVQCGTIRGTVRHNKRYSAAQYEVQCGTIRGTVLRHDTRSWIQNLGPNFFSLGGF